MGVQEDRKRRRQNDAAIVNLGGINYGVRYTDPVKRVSASSAEQIGNLPYDDIVSSLARAGDHLPWNSGSRLSKNALTPSLRSSLRNAVRRTDWIDSNS